jgi:hypothetical protein
VIDETNVSHRGVGVGHSQHANRNDPRSVQGRAPGRWIAPMPLFILLILLIGPVSGAFAQDTRLLVRAVNEDSGRPMPEVLIQVLHEESETVYAEIWTNDRGTVSVQVSPLESYIVRAVAAGYISQTDVAHAPPGEELTVTLGLSQIPPRPRLQYGVLSGRILSSEGEPLSQIGVAAYFTESPNSHHRAITAKDGSYRMEVPVGIYTVSTLGSITHTFPIPPVFDVHGAGQLKPVGVAWNKETTGADLRLPRLQHFRATVTVVGDTGPVSDGFVEWFSANGRGFGSSVQLNGSAEIGPLPPGRVTIFAWSGRKASQLAGMTSIEIQDAPKDDVTLNVFPGARLTGRILGPDGSRIRIPSELRMMVIPYPPGDRSQRSQRSHSEYLVGTDGAFVLGGLIGERCLEVTGLWRWPRWQVLSVTHQGIDFTSRPLLFDYGQEVDDVVIRIGPSDAPSFPERRCVS